MNHEKAKLRALIRNDLKFFTRKCFETLYPGKLYLENWHHIAIIYALSKCRTSPEHNRLLVNMPPQHMKSELISVIYSAWLLAHNPGMSIVNISYSNDLVRKFTRMVLKIMESSWYKEVFPNTRLSAKKKSESEIETTKGGRRYATTISGQLTGHGADVIIIDDPHKIGPGLTEEELEKSHQWYSEALSSRLTNPDKGVIIVVMQRTRPNDLAGYLLQNEDYQHLCLPLIATEDIDIPIADDKVHMRKKGEILHSEWRSEADLAHARKNPYTFESQYQQNPMPGGGFLIKPDYVNRYEDLLPRARYEYVLMAIDGASSLDEDASYSAIVIVGILNNRMAVLHVWRGHVEFPDLLRITEQKMDEFRPTHVIPEYAASGIQLTQILKKKYGWCGIYHTTPKGSKVDRFYEVLHFFSEKRVFLPKDRSKFPWLQSFEQELFTFPSCKTNDQVDAFTHTLRGIDLQVFRRPPVVYS